MRVIVAGRLSRKVTDRDQTGFDSQERESVRWAEYHGHTVVAVVADFKSGRSGLEARKNLRPWIMDFERLGQYDAIVALKVDRLTRGDRAETAKLEQWARDNGKSLIISGADVHFPSEGNEGIQWDMMLRMAHQEWLNTSERYLRMQSTLRADGFLIGRPDYGHRVVRLPSKHATLEIDPVCGPIAFQMADRYLNQGQTLATICAWTIAEGIKTQQGCDFSPKTLSQVLRNKSIAGRRRQGNTILRIPEIISLRDYEAIQRKLDSHAHRKGVPAADTAMLTGILFCAKCDAPMYRMKCTGKIRKDGSKARDILYYRCHGGVNSPSKCANMLPLKDMDATINDAVMALGWADHVARTLVPGDNHDAEIDEIRAGIRDLDLDDPDYDDSLSALRAEYARLRALPNEPDRWDERPTGRSVAEHWTRLDDAQRRAWLLGDGWSVHAAKDKGGEAVVTIDTERAYGTSLETLRTVA